MVVHSAAEETANSMPSGLEAVFRPISSSLAQVLLGQTLLVVQLLRDHSAAHRGRAVQRSANHPLTTLAPLPHCRSS